jgi:glycosyltransferase involved in cell wall biosynthesis
MPPARLLFVHYGDDWIRGSEQCLIDLMDGLNRARFTPIVWCNSAVVTGALAARGYDAQHYQFDLLFNWNYDLSNVGPYLRMIGVAKRLLEERSIDLVHCNSGGPAQWMIPACRSRRIPMLTHVHCAYSRRERYLLGLHQSPFLVGVSASTLVDFLAEGFPAERTRVIYNGIDTRRITSAPRPELRRELQLPENAFVVASIGSLVEHKGHDVVIQALGQAHRTPGGERVVGLIVGDGPDRAMLEQLARRLAVNVRFLGYRRDVGTILTEAVDVLALASRREALGLVLLEAAHFGVPAVATRVGGIPEIVRDGETGLLVPADDPSALAGALSRLATDRAFRDRLGEAARTRMRQQFTAAAMVGTFEEIYTRLLSEDHHTWGWLGRWNPLTPYWRLVTRRQSPGRGTQAG